MYNVDLSKVKSLDVLYMHDANGKRINLSNASDSVAKTIEIYAIVVPATIDSSKSFPIDVPADTMYRDMANLPQRSRSFAILI